MNIITGNLFLLNVATNFDRFGIIFVSRTRTH